MQLVIDLKNLPASFDENVLIDMINDKPEKNLLLHGHPFLDKLDINQFGRAGGWNPPKNGLYEYLLQTSREREKIKFKRYFKDVPHSKSITYVHKNNSKIEVHVLIQNNETSYFWYDGGRQNGEPIVVVDGPHTRSVHDHPPRDWPESWEKKKEEIDDHSDYINGKADALEITEAEIKELTYSKKQDAVLITVRVYTDDGSDTRRPIIRYVKLTDKFEDGSKAKSDGDIDLSFLLPSSDKNTVAV